MLWRLRARLKSTKPDRHARKKHDDQSQPPSTNDDDRIATRTDQCVSSLDEARTDNSPRRNLWEVAGERLDKKHREILEQESASPITNAIEGVIKTTEEKYREYKEGGLKIRKRDGGQIDVRETAQNIILYALQAQELVKALVSFDPTGHASSAWSVVSIGLTFIQNGIQRRDDIFEAAEYLARNLSYYAIVDRHYRESQVESNRGLEDALVEVYIAVLRYTAEVKEAEKESKVDRMVKSITALTQEPLKDLKNTIESKAQAVQKWTKLTEDLDRRREAESILDGIDEAVERLKIIQSQTRSLQDLEILDWLSTASYSNSQNNNQDLRASNTGNWFLNLPEYKGWKATPGEICWLYGAVIQDIEEHCKPDSSRQFAYWYFQFSNDETSIIRQFMPKTLPESMVKLWEEHRPRGSNPHQQKLAEILDIVLEASEDQFFLILDALDECPAKNGERGLLLPFLEDLLGKHPTKLHILATSRPEPDIRSRLEQYQSVNLEAGLAKDVETFVRAQVTHGRLSAWDDSIKERTLEKLLDISERRFRWADLQIKRLEESKTEDAFFKALDSIPVTLEDTYRDTLERLPPDDRKAARTILIWLSFSAIPLDLKTVAAVVSFRFPEDVVTTCTTSLVTVSISDDTVRLAHFSVKEFLVCNEIKGQWYQFSTLSGHDVIANQSIDSLLETTEILTKTTAVQSPLLIYAANYWDYHLAELGDLHARSTGLQEKVDHLFTERDVYFNWVRLEKYYLDRTWLQSLEELKPPLYNASLRGVKPTVEMLLAKGANPLGTIYNGSRDALSAAAAAGHLEILELLLNNMDEIPRNVTASMLMLIRPAEADREKLSVILNLLWDKGALHDQLRASHRIIDERLVEAAASNQRRLGYVLMDQLLDQKEKMGVKITEKVMIAVLNNDECGAETMNLLLNRCVEDIRLTPSLMQALLSADNTDAAIIVLSRQVNNIALDEKSLGALTICNKEVVEMLFRERGEEICVTQKVLITAARFARDLQALNLLLNRREPGADIDKEVLLAAAQNIPAGNGILDLLLDQCGQDAAIDDEIIQAIAENPVEGLAMIKTLLRRQQPGFVVTEQVLCNAATFHNLEMLELLVSNASRSNPPITSRILGCVAHNLYHTQALMNYLFDLRGHRLPVSEDFLVSLADESAINSDYVLTFILERWPKIPVTDRLFEAACCIPNALGLLLDRRHDCLPIERMIQRITEDHTQSGRALEVLLDRQLVEVTEWLVEMTVSNIFTLEIIYNRDPEFPVTPRIVASAIRNVDTMRLLLDRQKNQVLITEEMVKASLDAFFPSDIVSLLLTRLGPEAVPITENILIYAVQIGEVEALELFLKQHRDLNLRAVWEAMWQDPEISSDSLAGSADALFHYASFDVSDQMLERLSSEDFDDFIRSCMQHRIPLPTTKQHSS
ncbi:uncharacterized protein BO95DRAFT_480367 [Aspergillus brunneoviolaceus CBS 621.78]|uniref:Uncharacterized protein n=1 Tax=Aspergillus brunneoviolaceus CBS 621.78 TaxID=1450534 RepID=A0ACD1GGB7_9EURO|nr:hypothetical protein BO95DRAFT_480367 [Aspergillus brunneoviolaceus CBS 621.78]RAH48293.1 hypothetical protein BO95DRAFT_480367 [Aspergillus brunneoviolaceus CBS 621.78]